MGVLPQGGAEETSCGWISQLKVCQLISASPQVIYPVGLNWHNEPVITTLSEPLSRGTSVIACKNLYLGINIPSSPMEESEHKVLPIGKASPNTVPSLPKSPPKFKCSMAAKVDNLLTQAMADVSGCESKHSPLGKITTVSVIMSPPQKSEVSLKLVNTSSQASAEEAEASLEDLPANISPIAAAYSSRCVSPPVDPSELQAHANTAINNMLHLKRSLDVKRQRAAWELGALMCQSQSQESASVTKARAICSQAIFDAQMICSQLVLEAKTNCLVAVREAKTVQSTKLRLPVLKPSMRLWP